MVDLKIQIQLHVFHQPILFVCMHHRLVTSKILFQSIHPGNHTVMQFDVPTLGMHVEGTQILCISNQSHVLILLVLIEPN